MEISEELRQKVRIKRAERQLTHSQLSNLCGVGISTLSSIESGSLKQVKYETILKIARTLGIRDVAEKAEDQNEIIKVGFGFTMWSSPLINLIINDAVPESIATTCFWDKTENDELIAMFGIRPDETPSTKLVYTANQLKKSLQDNTFDAIFLPFETVHFKTDFLPIARIMDTTKGGVNILVVTKGTESPTVEELINSIDSSDGDQICGLYYPKDTIAEIEMRRLFPNFQHKKGNFDVTDLSQLPGSVEEPIEKYFFDGCKHVIFSGWDVNIIKTKNNIELLNDQQYKCDLFESYEFISKSKPFSKICLDLVIRKENLENLKQDKRFKSFLESLESSIRIINSSKNNHLDYHMAGIAKFLSVRPELLQEKLRLIEFELSFYPEWIF